MNSHTIHHRQDNGKNWKHVTDRDPLEMANTIATAGIYITQRTQARLKSDWSQGFWIGYGVMFVIHLLSKAL